MEQVNFRMWKIHFHHGGTETRRFVLQPRYNRTNLMRFEARELKDYVEPVSAGGLRVGEAYFALQFEDEDLKVPVLYPLVFIGRNLEPGDDDLLYFQDYGSFAAGTKYEDEQGEADFHVFGASDLNHIFEFERALDGLLRCSLHRRETTK